MGTMRKLLADERGMILVLSLLILALLMGAGVGAIVSTQTDLKTSSNFKTASQAFFLAEAGIEWAKQEVKKSGANPPNPSGATQTLSPGSFTVSFCNTDACGAGKESQLVGKVRVTSTGTVGSSTATLMALIKKTYELSDGAISMRGETNTNFTGSSFCVDGHDYNVGVTATCGTGYISSAKTQFGISVATAPADTEVTNALTQPQQLSRVQGKGAAPDVQESSFLPSSEMTELANDICNDPAAANTDISASGYTVPAGKTTWGTTSAPAIKCFTANSDGDQFTIDPKGSLTGVGILVVRNADLYVRGNFDWQGLIIVTGTNVSFTVDGGGSGNIYGSIMINETGSDAGKELDLQGNINVRYSSQALQKAMSAVDLSRNPLQDIYDSTPSTISQVYWRTVSN